MTPERWARIKEVLATALEQPEQQRATFLNQACGSDQDLRQEVESLLAEAQDSWLKSLVESAPPPELGAGQVLGRYRVETKLGQGGMGAVYKAHDTVLRRSVALKVLPPGCLADSEHKQRLTREARAASALNHPNIVTIHDIGSENGTDFIAMELIEGQPLDRMIPGKGLPLHEALGLAVQIAQGMVAAHGAGIVHRDLKPANVMVTRSGLVKLLDFGLARRVEAVPGEGSTVTAQGVIAGTVAYMSPEQAEGKPVDARSDIFSFGSVLYEMVSGQRAFRGETQASTLAAVISQEPAALRTEIPHDLEQVITRCLRKDPARRFQHMDDVKIALEELKEQSDSRKLPTLTPTLRPRRLWLWVVAACVFVAASVAVWLTVFGRKTPPSALTAVPLTTYPGDECCPSLSPDGNQVAFAWNGEKQDNYDIYVQVIGSGVPLRLTTDPARDTSPAWSPDGRNIAFVRYVSGKTSIMLIPPLGGTERVLTEVNDFGNLTPPGSWLSWTPDSRWIAYPEIARGERAGVFLLSIETGEKRRLTTPPRPFRDFWLAISPGGRTLAFIRSHQFSTGEVYLLRLSGDFQPQGEPLRLSWENQSARTPAWSADGREVIYSGGELMARGLRRIRVDRMFSSGSQGPAQIEMLPFPGDIAESPAVSGARRRLVYGKASWDVDIWRVDLGGGAQYLTARPFISSTYIDQVPQFSPSGKKIAFHSNRSGGYEEWVCNLDGSGQEKLTSMEASMAGPPLWSPDGEWIVFDSTASGQFDLYVVAASGGRPRRLTSHPAVDAVPSWSHDGKWIYFMSDRTGQPQVWKMPAKGGDAVQVTKQGGYVAFESPDGKTLYYSKNSGSSSLWKAPVAGGEETKVLDAVTFLNFAVTGRGIYFIPPRDAAGRSSIQFLDFSTGKTRLIHAIEKPVEMGLTVSPDYRTILYTQFEKRSGDLMLVENFR